MTSPALRRAAFLDRDGTLIEDRNYLKDPDGVVLVPNAAAAVRVLNDAGVVAVIVTNQSGIAQGFLTEADYAATAERSRELFRQAGATIDGMYHCPHYPEISGPCDCRKPGTLLYRRAAQDFHVDLTRSAYIGDRMRDILPSQSLGGVGILVASAHTPADERDRAARDFVVANSLGDAVALFLAR